MKNVLVVSKGSTFLGLFCATSNWLDYIAQNEKKLVNNKLERMWKD
jgi:hypothetical protein